MESLHSALDTPWKVVNEVDRWFVHPIVRLKFMLNNISWGRSWRFNGIPIIQKHRRSAMSFGDGLSLRSSIRSNPLGPNHPVILCTWQAGAQLNTGQNFAMTGGTLCAAQSIQIGDHVAIGANSLVIDTDFHPLDPQARRQNSAGAISLPIIIEDDVFIGMNCLILKGVRLGEGCVIGAGSVVTKDVPPFMIAAGNPARIIKKVPETFIE